MKKILSFMMAAATLTGGLTSCSDFLEEENKTGESAELSYNTKSGIEGLVSAMYAYGRGYWGKEGAHGLTEGGTDLFYKGGDNQQSSLVTYDFGSECPGTSTAANKNSTCLDQYWEYFFAGVDVCNNVIKWVPQCINLETEADKNIYLGEAYFMKSLLYSQMVAIWGPLPWNDEAAKEIKTTIVREPEAVIYKNILTCLDRSLEYLVPGKAPSADGHATYYSALALKARVALYAASWLGKDAVEGYDDLYKVAKDCAEEVISNSGASFYDNASYTWNIANEDATVNKECLFAVHYTENAADLANNGVPYRFGSDKATYGTLINRNGTTSQGNCMNLFYVSKWSNGNSGGDFGSVKSNCNDIFNRVTDAKSSVKNGVDVGKYYSPYGLGYRRYLPSLYLWQEFDKIKNTDQRYNATMLTSYNCHPELVKYATKYPKMAEQSYKTYEEAYKEDGNYFNGGVPAIVYCFADGDSPEGQAIQAEAKDKYRLQFAFGGDIPIYTSSDPATALPTSSKKAISDVYGDARYNNADVGGLSSYPGIKKFLNDELYQVAGETYYPCSKQVSKRDCIVLRLAEMYLIKAEAELQTGDADAATSTINELRAVRAIEGQDNSISAVYGESQIDLDGILRERALELCGEYQRWFDLKRTHKLLEYIKGRNAQASGNIALKHYYRPIPATEFALCGNKSAETFVQYPEGNEKEGVIQYNSTSSNFWQNPGFDY